MTCEHPQDARVESINTQLDQVSIPRVAVWCGYCNAPLLKVHACGCSTGHEFDILGTYVTRTVCAEHRAAGRYAATLGTLT